MNYLRLPKAPEGTTPFRALEGGGVEFDGQDGRRVDYGHVFDAARGYRVYFKFFDSPFSNTFGPESLKRWAETLEPADDTEAALKALCIEQAEQCLTLTAEWERIGRPAKGLDGQPGGRA